MQSRTTRHSAPRAPIAPLHRGPQAHSVSSMGGSPFQHAPNAALLIDFDNVTMGIRSDLAGELRNLLGSEIIKGKVAVQRAYADWRRYPQYIVPLAESSIDMIMAPAYGSSKKNATDIRLSVDAIELVFTRPEIGTYILLSGDSDFASLVTKLKEYGKYVIGVGIRESSSDLLVMNCDEYYSYTALAGLVKASDEEVVKWDPWELVVEAIGRMRKNGDVMRSDRLKQVMQDVDSTFDEKNVGHGYSKFSKFVQDAADKGLVKTTKLENGQLEVSPAEGVSTLAAPAGESGRATPAVSPALDASREERAGGARRSRRGRGRDRDRTSGDGARSTPRVAESVDPAPAPQAPPVVPARSVSTDPVGRTGERLTRQEAFDLLKNAVAALVSGSEDAVLSSVVRKKAFDLLGRDSESLGERNFHRILRDAHDTEVIDLRRRGDDYEVSLPAKTASVADQVKAAELAATPVVAVGSTPAAPRGMGPRGMPQRGRGSSAPPPELFMVGVVETTPAPAPAAAAKTVAPVVSPAKKQTRAKAVAARPTAKPVVEEKSKGAVARKSEPKGSGAPQSIKKPKAKAAKKAAAIA